MILYGTNYETVVNIDADYFTANTASIMGSKSELFPSFPVFVSFSTSVSSQATFNEEIFTFFGLVFETLTRALYRHGECTYPQPTDYMYLLETTSEYNFLPKFISKEKNKNCKERVVQITNTVGACRRNTKV